MCDILIGCVFGYLLDGDYLYSYFCACLYDSVTRVISLMCRNNSRYFCLCDCAICCYYDLCFYLLNPFFFYQPHCANIPPATHQPNSSTSSLLTNYSSNQSIFSPKSSSSPTSHVDSNQPRYFYSMLTLHLI